MTNLDSIFKSRDITLPTKVHLVKAMVFPVVMYGCESGTVKKAEPQKIDAFELWCWRRLLGVPWTARRSNQSILKEIGPGVKVKEKARSEKKAKEKIVELLKSSNEIAPVKEAYILYGLQPEAALKWKEELINQ